jgi:hypothetical protein
VSLASKSCKALAENLWGIWRACWQVEFFLAKCGASWKMNFLFWWAFHFSEHPASFFQFFPLISGEKTVIFVLMVPYIPYLSMKQGSLFLLFCFVLMRSTELGCFRLHSWFLWKALEEEGCISLVSWRLDLQCRSSWILNDFCTKN